MTNIAFLDPRAAIIPGIELGTLRPFARGDKRGPGGAIIIAKPKGGTAGTRKVVAR